jgi:Egh16-like virulence factor
MYSFTQVLAFGLFASAVSAHGVITGATGDQGGVGTALGVDPATPRDGTNRTPFQADTTVFKGDNAATFGRTTVVSSLISSHIS